MKKQILLSAGILLLCGMGVSAQDASKDKPLWTMDFEHGMDMFDEEHPDSRADSIVNLEYYMWLTSDQESGSNFFDPKNPKVFLDMDTLHTATIDTTIYLYHGIELRGKDTDGGQFNSKDTANVFEYAKRDPKGNEELAALGSATHGGNKFFRWAAQSDRKTTKAYTDNLYVRGLPIQPGKSYRLTFYMKANSNKAQVDARLMRGWYESEKAFNISGKDDDSKSFVGTVKGSDWYDKLGNPDSSIIDHWKSYTFMFYYSSDSLSNITMHSAYHWGGLWSGKYDDPEELESKRWSRIFNERRGVSPDLQSDLAKKAFTKKFAVAEGDTIDSIWGSKIVQPNTFFLRFGFIGENTVYHIDDIALYESNIGAAEYSGELIRLNFGYQTNIPDICKKSTLGRIELADEEGEMLENVFTLKDNAGGKYEIIHAEYQSDGMVYLWLDSPVDAGDSLWLSFKNPDDNAFRLLYTKDLRPYFEKGKASDTVPDFEDELIRLAAFAPVPSIADVPPTVATATPVEGSFNLNTTDDVHFTFKFTRDVYDEEDVSDKFGIRLVNSDAKAEKAVIYLNDYRSKFNKADSTITLDLTGVNIPNGIYDMEFMNLRAYNEGPSDFTFESAGNGKPFKIEYTWGADFKENDKTTEGKNYKKVKESYTAAYDYAYDPTLLETKSLISFKKFLEPYEPDAFLAKHKNPADYDAGKKAIDDELAKLKSAMEIPGKFTSARADAKSRLDFMGKFANIASNKKYTDLKSLYDTFAGKDYSDKEVDEILSDYNQLLDGINNLESLTDPVLQANELYELCKTTLKVGFSKDNADFIEEQIKLTSYNEDLVAKLKLEAIRAIYMTLNKGENIDSADVSGFIENPSFYTSAMLDVDVEAYYAQYHTDTTDSLCSYRIKLDAPYSTVYPGWTIQTSVTSGWGGPNPYGVWNDPRDGWFKTKGVYVEKEGQITAGAIGADWGSAFNIKQEIADLPEGTYTLCLPSIVPNPSNPKNKLLDKIIIGKDTIESNAYMNAVGTMKTPLVAGDTLHIEYDHDKYTDGTGWFGARNEFQNGCFVNNVFLYLVSTSAGAGKYAGQIAAIEDKITEIEEIEVADESAVLYNMNGVRVSALRPGEMGIRVDANGNAQKVVNF